MRYQNSRWSSVTWVWRYKDRKKERNNEKMTQKEGRKEREKGKNKGPWEEEKKGRKKK